MGLVKIIEDLTWRSSTVSSDKEEAAADFKLILLISGSSWSFSHALVLCVVRVGRGRGGIRLGGCKVRGK